MTSSVTITYGWFDPGDENSGEWSGPRTVAARSEVRCVVAAAFRRRGLECGAHEVRVRWDGTWTVPAHRPGSSL